MRKKRYSETIEIADALLDKGSAYEGLIREGFQRKYPNGDVPAALRPALISLRKNADSAFDRAEAFGLRATDGQAETQKTARQQRGTK
jgi:hypothetical protein